MRKIRAALAVSALAASMFVTGASTAHAVDPEPSPAAIEVGDVIVESGESAQIDISDAQLNAARTADAAKPDSAAEKEAEAATLAELPALRAADVDTFTVGSEDGQGDIIVSAPTTVSVASIDISVEPSTSGEPAVSVDTTSVADDSGLALEGSAGPGMAPYLSPTDEDNYSVTIRGIGRMFTLYSRSKLMNDNRPNYAFYAASTKAVATPYELTGFNAIVVEAIIQTWPVASTRNSTSEWVDFSPLIGFPGCNEGGNTPTVTVSAKILSVSFTPTGCGDYTVWRNFDVPGSYQMHLDQGVVLHGGDRALAFATAWRTPENVLGSQMVRTWMKLKRDHITTACDLSSSESANTTCEVGG